MKRQKFCGISVLVIFCLIAGCDNQTPVNEEMQRSYYLTIVYPQSSTELVGGQSFRVTIFLADSEDNPLGGALVEVQIIGPEGEDFNTLHCVDKHNGRYLCDPVTLPLKKSQGIWQISVRAYMGTELIALSKGKFTSSISYSERLFDHFGFWLALPDLFPYNVPNAEDPLLKTYSYKNGGYIILANNISPPGIDSSFVILDVHWQNVEYPKDENEVVDYVLNLAGPHRITLDLSETELKAEEDKFQGWPAWHVTGIWERIDALGNPRSDAVLDWMIFKCPGSDWLWAVLITTNQIEYLDDLNRIRETFECSID
jgi:hypothetical protein